ncbi:MAG: DUF86 domain-containing protein [Candidatus Altiarchaeota archaeon]
MNKQRIARIVKEIDRYAVDLEALGVKKSQDLKDTEKFYATSMVLFSMVNQAINLGEEIVSAKKLGFPESYREVFTLLEDNGIIDDQLRKEFSHLIHFRNLAAHEYHTFTAEDVYEAYNRIKAVNRFITAIKKELKEQ